MKFILSLMLLFSFSLSARDLLLDYGADKYMLDLQMGDLKRVHNTIHEYENRVPAMSLGMHGTKTILSIFNEESMEGERYSHAYWNGISMFTDIDNEEQIENMFLCYDQSVRLLDSEEVDKKLDVSFSVPGLRKWQVYQEPRNLYFNRHQIYSIRRGIRAINTYLIKAEKSGNVKAVQILKELKASILAKHESFLEQRDQMLATAKPWEPRRYVWFNLNNNPGECSVEKAHQEVLTPLDYVMEKLEAIRRKYQF